MNDALIVSLLSAVPKNRAARAMGWASRLRLPAAMHRALVRWFIRKYRVDLSECVGGIDDFDTLAAFFVRGLRPGVRPIDDTADVLVSPVDAHVHTFGSIKDGLFIQADSRTSTVAALLGLPPGASTPHDPFDPARYEGGGFAVLYLSPQDYHRVHTTHEGTLSAWRYIPGTLWPVFAAATRRVPGLFARNERLAFSFETDLGRVTQILVGAFGVGRITSRHADVVSNTGRPARGEVLEPPRPITRGEELGRFELGSTVILLTEPGRVRWLLQPGATVRLGQPIAAAMSSAH